MDKKLAERSVYAFALAKEKMVHQTARNDTGIHTDTETFKQTVRPIDR